MNKKIMSFVLAMVLSVGLGCGKLLAYEYTGGVSGSSNDNIHVSMEDLEKDVGAINRTGTGSNGEVVGAVNETTSRICAVFNYSAGIVVSVVDADRNVTLYNEGNPFISLGYNDDGTFTVTGVTLQGTDYDRVKEAGGLKSFLLSLGVPETALKKTAGDVTEEDRTNGTIAQEDVAWLAQAEAQLAKGINHSISINLTAQYGASVTYCENGKALETIAYDGTCIAQYHYNAAGTLETIDQMTYEVDDIDTSGSGEEKRVTGADAKKVWTTVHMDKFGRQSYITDSGGQVTGRYTYSSNGSIASVWDGKTNNTTYYTGGKQAYVLNDRGFMTQQFFYHENGSLDGIKTWNFDQDTGEVTGTSISAYRWGNFVGSADLASGTGVQTFDQLRAAVDYIKKDPDAVLEDLKNGAELNDDEKAILAQEWTSIYGDQLTSAEKKGHQAKNYKGSGKDAVGYWKDQNKAAEEKMEKTKSEDAEKLATRNTSMYGNITAIGLYSADLKNQKLMNFLGIDPRDVNAMATMSNGYSMVGSAKITIDTLAYQTSTGNAVRESMGLHIAGGTTVGEQSSGGIVGQQMSVQLTVNDHGGQSYAANCTPTVLRDPVTRVIQQRVDSDPVIEGTFQGTVEIDGKTYAIIGDGNINMMDGSGFHSMEGETMLVDISDMSEEEIAAMKNAEGGKVMFMGNVGYTSDGKLAITMDRSYGGGYRFGTDAVNAEIDRVVGVANGSIAPAADGSDNWILENTEKNIAKLGEGFMNDSQGKVSDRLKEAWEILF